MGLIKPDFTEMSEPLAHGDYKARVVDDELAETQTGKQQLKVTLEIFGCQGDKESYNGKKLTYFAMLAGKGAFRLHDLWKAATGVDLPKDCGSLNTDEIRGKAVTVTLGPEKDQNGNEKRFPGIVGIAQAS